MVGEESGGNPKKHQNDETPSDGRDQKRPKLSSGDDETIALSPQSTKVADCDYSTYPHKPNPAYPVTLLQGDFCPFANRALIALLEKEEDPNDPKLFEKVHVCYNLGPKKDRGTGWLYSLGYKTVPAIIDNTTGGQAMNESMDVVERVEVMFPNNPLAPKETEAKEHMKAMIEKHGATIPTIYKLLMEQSVEAQKGLAKTLLEQVTEMNEDLKKSKGPYFCGDEFTIADIAFFPFYERLIILLGHYRGFVIPKELNHVHTWYKTIQQRPSVKVTTADRDEGSLNTYCFEEKERAKYLIECYESYANGEVDLGKKYGMEASAPGVNGYRKYKKEQASEKAEDG
ncbi:MAG: hypothetical protein SGBAC_006716 [Bacillariaceae sp.]